MKYLLGALCGALFASLVFIGWLWWVFKDVFR